MTSPASPQQQQQLQLQQRQFSTLEIAIIQCRNELIRLAQLIEANPPSIANAAVATTGNTTKQSSIFDSVTSFVKEHNFGFGDDDDNDNSKNHGKNSKSTTKNAVIGEAEKKKRELEQEYLQLAKSCQQAAKISELEANSLRDSIKLLKALKEAAEDERDHLEDKLDEQRTLIDSLKEANMRAILTMDKNNHNNNNGTGTPAGSLSREPSHSNLAKVVSLSSASNVNSDANQRTKPENTNNNNNNSSQMLQDQQSQFQNLLEQQQTQQQSIQKIDVAVEVNLDQENFSDPLDSDVECKNCVGLRARLAGEEERALKKEKFLESELEAKKLQIEQITQEWKSKLGQVADLESKKSEAEIRKSAASFLQRTTVAEAAASKKLLQSEMSKLEITNQLSKTLKEMEDIKLDHEHATRTYESQISKQNEEMKELRRVIHKISVHNNSSEYQGARTESTDQWTTRDDQAVGSEDSKGAFHAWLHATASAPSNLGKDSSAPTTPRGNNSDDNNNNNNNVVTVPVDLHQSAPSGILESARRMLSAKLVASNGHVSVEDETVARALHHTNETLRDALEENMKLQLKIKELELQLKIKELESKVAKK